MDLEVFGCLDLGPPQCLPPLLYAFAKSRSRKVSHGFGRGGFMAFEALIRRPNDLRWLNEDRGLEPVLRPAVARREDFVPVIILPGSNDSVPEERIKGLFQTVTGLEGFRVSSVAPTASRRVATRKGCQ